MNTDAGVISFPQNRCNIYDRVTATVCDLIPGFLRANKGVRVSFDNRRPEHCSFGCNGITVIFSREGDTGLKLEVRIDSPQVQPCTLEYRISNANEWPRLIADYTRDRLAVFALRDEPAQAPALLLLSELMDGGTHVNEQRAS